MSDSLSLDKTRRAYCPEFVSEVFCDFGYSYWSRSHQSGVTVCGDHNVF